MNIPTKTLEKYLKIRRLAQKGESGEQNVARMRMAKMERDYPDIKNQADLWERMDQEDWGENSRQPEPESKHWSEVYSQPEQTEWKQQFAHWGKMASNAFSWAAGVAGHAFGVRQAQMLATEPIYTQIKTKLNPSGSFSINVKLNPDTVLHLTHSLTGEQKTIFVNSLAQRFAEQLFAELP